MNIKGYSVKWNPPTESNEYGHYFIDGVSPCGHGYIWSKKEIEKDDLRLIIKHGDFNDWHNGSIDKEKIKNILFEKELAT